MDDRGSWTAMMARILSRWMLGFLVLSYVFSALVPGPGLWIKDAELLRFDEGGFRLVVTLPKVMLSFLLLNAGLHVRFERMGELARRPLAMAAGLAANLAIPLGFIVGLVATSGYWHNSQEFSMLLVGLSVVAAMPIAGSSTAWTRATDGDMTLSLGLVVVSTLCSPISTPAVLGAVEYITPSHLGSDLARLAEHGTSRFLMAWVLVPSLVGMVLRLLLGGRRVVQAETWLKILTSLTLLILCYANSASCLPIVLRTPDWDFLLVVGLVVTSLCAITFTAGYWIGKVLGLDSGGQKALMFGLGMNNNGTGLVLAATALNAEPTVLLPVIAYNLAQHVVAGCASVLHRWVGQD